LIFRERDLAGLVTIELEEAVDDRGSFARTFDAAAWEEHGLCARVVQSSRSRNTERATLRGLHYQAAPHGEHKLVRCSRGAIFDVAVDLRAESPTFCRWFGLELSEQNGTMLYIPPGFAHGFVTLTPAAEVLYQMSEPYMPSHARGVRWDDPVFGIDWPLLPASMSERDRTYPDFDPSP
jgi:dTDP-4-dehydrorhamnose 3,5-epimerase